ARGGRSPAEPAGDAAPDARRGDAQALEAEAPDAGGQGEGEQAAPPLLRATGGAGDLADERADQEPVRGEREGPAGRASRADCGAGEGAPAAGGARGDPGVRERSEP